jgi:hypothetical protein
VRKLIGKEEDSGCRLKIFEFSTEILLIQQGMFACTVHTVSRGVDISQASQGMHNR